MRWVKIFKAAMSLPAASKNYKDCKAALAVEGHGRCVYCAILEKPLGGYWHFHVEHFRPKSKFPDLTNEYSNLFYACAICNTFKSSDWPGEPNEALSTPSYADPSQVDYNSIFNVDDRGSLTGANVAASYMITKIYLNRPQLILERRDSLLQDKLDHIYERCSEYAEELIEKSDPESNQLLREFFGCIRAIRTLETVGRSVRPYEPSDTSRH